MEKYKNLFISFEGGEGVGKTSVSKLVQEIIKKEGGEIFLTREPGGSGLKIAEDIRNIIMEHSDINPISELLLFAANRKEHMQKKVIPNLEKGNYVLCDRFSDSTIVYQGMTKGIDLDIIKTTNDIATDMKYPDLTFIFDLDPIVGLERIAINQREKNRFDENDLKFHTKIRESYLELAKQDLKRYKIIDASKSVEEIANEVVKIIKEYEKN